MKEPACGNDIGNGSPRMHRFFQRLSIGLLLLGSVLFFAGGPEDLGTRSLQRAWDLGHLVFFFAATAVWLYWRRQSESAPGVRTWILVLVVVNLAGFAIEGTQHLLGRDAAATDLLLNNVGSLVALALFAIRRDKPSLRTVSVLRGAALALLLWSLVPLIAALSDELSASKAFPVLADFETPFQLSRWESDVPLSLERGIVRHGKGAMRVPLSTALYSTASLVYFPGDWRGTTAFAASIFNPESEPLELVLRVHDEWHDEHGQSYYERFNTTLKISTGWNDISVPIADILNGPSSRIMDVERIAGLSFFSVELPSPRTIIIDQVELR